jgi:CysZ protein
MIRGLGRALWDLRDWRLLGVLLKGLLLSLVVFGLVVAGIGYLLQQQRFSSLPWLDGLVKWLGLGGATVLALLVFPVTFTLIQSMLLDGVADRIEARHYASLGPASGTPLWAGIRSGLAITALLIALHGVMLPVYGATLWFLGTGIVLYTMVNGWVSGRELHDQVTLRRIGKKDERQAAWKRDRWGAWSIGSGVSLFGSVPVLNLVAPWLGCILMVHWVHRGAVRTVAKK